MKLGKKPARHDPRTLDYARYRTGTEAPPKQAHWGHGLTFAMDGNDTLGDCVEAAYAHQVQVWGIHAATLTEAEIPGESDAVAAYSAIAGYVPGDPPTDQGTGMLAACSYWKSSGMAGQKISAFAALDPRNSSVVMESVAWFGGAYIGVQLPLSAQDQVGSQWAVETGPDAEAGSWGGHCVPVVGYGPDQLWCVTWGTLQSMTWEFFTTYCDEAYVLLSQDWIKASRSVAVPAGVGPAARGPGQPVSGDPKPDGPASPMTVLMQGAAQLHEMLSAYVQAGFSRREALYLCGQVLSAHVQQASGTESP